jgi:hypothetical protein
MPIAAPCGGRLFLKPAPCLLTLRLLTLFLLTWTLFRPDMFLLGVTD